MWVFLLYENKFSNLLFERLTQALHQRDALPVRGQRRFVLTTFGIQTPGINPLEPFANSNSLRFALAFATHRLHISDNLR
jgi:hypothetical protein